MIMSTIELSINVRSKLLGTIGVLLIALSMATDSQAKILKAATDSLEGTQLSTQDGRISLVETPRRAGTHAFKHVITNSTERAEIGKLSPPGRADSNVPYWYGWSFMHMSEPAIPNGKFTIVMQMYQGHRDAGLWPCGGGGHKISVVNRELQYHLQYGTGSIKCNRYTLATFDQIKDKWVDVVLNVVWSTGGNGYFKLWLRIGGDSGTWEQKIDYKGATIASGEAPYTKIGPYVGNPKNGERLVYTDEFRWADASSTFEDVAPGGKSTGPPAASTFNLNLAAGWNLISLPLKPTNPSVDKVLTPISGKYDAIYAYDSAEGQYSTFIPGGENNDLTTLAEGRGYWIYMNQAGTLTVNGSPAEKAVQLRTGWNLVGLNSTAATASAAALASIEGKYSAVYGYDSSTAQYRGYIPSGDTSLSSLKPGEGYWIFADSNAVWNLP
jgi:hypothetical protein